MYENRIHNTHKIHTHIHLAFQRTLDEYVFFRDQGELNVMSTVMWFISLMNINHGRVISLAIFWHKILLQKHNLQLQFSVSIPVENLI